MSVGDGPLDHRLDRAGAIVRCGIGNKVVSGVREAEAHRGRSMGRFVGDLRDDRILVNRGRVEVVHDPTSR